MGTAVCQGIGPPKSESVEEIVGGSTADDFPIAGGRPKRALCESGSM